MKKISWFAMLLATCSGISTANAKLDDDIFQREIMTGLDLVGVRETIDTIKENAPGELGREVYETASAVQTKDTQLFIPTSMYLRMGGGLNLGFATDSAQLDENEYESSGSYSAIIGLGWNLSSYVRAELDFQNTMFKFSDLDNHQAVYQTIGGMLYFDLAKRYVQNGDITHRRTFVPFIGVGAGMGTYEFQGVGGADGFVIAAPRATAGFNIMFNDLIGLDIEYQYQLMIGNGFGWNTNNKGANSVSNIMALIRANF